MHTKLSLSGRRFVVSLGLIVISALKPVNFISSGDYTGKFVISAGLDIPLVFFIPVGFLIPLGFVLSERFIILTGSLYRKDS